MQIVTRAIILALLTLCTVSAQAQMHRVCTGRGASATITIYDSGYVDTPPSFPGGESQLYDFIIATRCYPREAYEKGIEGRVICTFIINTDGAIGHINVIRSVEESLDREAVRIIKEMPRWNAGMLDDRPVPVKYVLAIPFRQ